MKKNSPILQWLLIAVAVLPVVYLYIIWDKIPATIPLHYNFNFEADKTGSKSFLWIPTSILSVVSIFVYLLFKNIHRIDPKRRSDQNAGIYQRLGAGVLVFVTSINFVMIDSMERNIFTLKHVLFPLMGLLFAFMGNYMFTIKPNYFAGIRLPWTLNNENNWRKTHQLAGKMWFAGGLLIAILSPFLPFLINVIFVLTVIFIMLIIPGVYSYKIFKQEKSISK